MNKIINFNKTYYDKLSQKDKNFLVDCNITKQNFNELCLCVKSQLNRSDIIVDQAMIIIFERFMEGE